MVAGVSNSNCVLIINMEMLGLFYLEAVIDREVLQSGTNCLFEIELLSMHHSRMGAFDITLPPVAIDLNRRSAMHSDVDLI